MAKQSCKYYAPWHVPLYNSSGLQKSQLHCKDAHPTPVCHNQRRISIAQSHSMRVLHIAAGEQSPVGVGVVRGTTEAERHNRRPVVRDGPVLTQLQAVSGQVTPVRDLGAKLSHVEASGGRVEVQLEGCVVPKASHVKQSDSFWRRNGMGKVKEMREMKALRSMFYYKLERWLFHLFFHISMCRTILKTIFFTKTNQV